MKKFEYTIKDEMGIHARPAGMLVKLAKELSSAVTITKGDRTVEATKLLAIMSLGVKKGEEITVSADSEEDLEKLKKFFEENL